MSSAYKYSLDYFNEKIRMGRFFSSLTTSHEENFLTYLFSLLVMFKYESIESDTPEF